MKLTRTAGAAAGVVGIAAAAALLLWPAPHAGDSLSPVTLPTATSTTAQSSPMSAAAEEYSREEFGPRWADVDRNGCDTRNDVLRRDLADAEIRGGTRGCVVQAGVLEDPYSGARVSFDRSRDPEAVQIDHVVSLSDAWSSGAWRWDAQYRAAFANDPLELVAASAAENNAKSDATADAWLPDDPADACALVVRQVSIKVRTELSVTRAEHDAMARVLDGCGDLTLLTSDDVDWPAPAR